MTNSLVPFALCRSPGDCFLPLRPGLVLSFILLLQCQIFLHVPLERRSVCPIRRCVPSWSSPFLRRFVGVGWRVLPFYIRRNTSLCWPETRKLSSPWPFEAFPPSVVIAFLPVENDLSSPTMPFFPSEFALKLGEVKIAPSGSLSTDLNLPFEQERSPASVEVRF